MNLLAIQEHWFWKYTFGKNRLFSKSLEKNELRKNIKLSLFLFYGLLYFVLIDYLFVISTDLIFEPITNPEWALFWTKLFDFGYWHIVFLAVSLVTNTICFLDIGSSSKRAVNFVSFFLLFSALNSYPKISHGLHVLLIPMFFFCFISIKNNATYKNAIVFASAIVTFLLSYTMAGFWKIMTGVYHLYIGDKSNFDSDVMSRMILYKFKYDEPTVLSQWFIDHPNIGYILFWSGVIIEFLAVFIFFIPKLHRVWGLALILFHIGIANLMVIHYKYAIIVIIPLLLCTPFLNNKFVTVEN